jgi:ribosome modulation factor
MRIGKGGDSALDEGRKAYRRNESIEKCPYVDSALRQAWIGGWRSAQSEFEKS